MKSFLLPAVLLAASAAFSSWSTPGLVSHVFSNVGCGADSGRSFMLTEYAANPNNPYVLKSNSPIFGQSTAMLERAVADQLPVAFFTRISDSTQSFSYVADDGSCRTKSWTEITGVSINSK